jgi:hypothetical protein
MNRKQGGVLAVVCLVLAVAAGDLCLSLQKGATGTARNGSPPRPAAKDPLPPSGKLKITVNGVRREMEQTRIAYSFEWVERRGGEPYFGFMRGWGGIDILFWDANGVKLEDERTAEFFCPKFVTGRTRLHEGDAGFSTPPGAKFVAVGFSRAGVLSKKTALPE